MTYRLLIDQVPLVDPEHEHESAKHLDEAFGGERTDAFIEAVLVDGPDLDHIHDARARQARLTSAQ